MSEEPISRISSSDLDNLMSTLEVHFVALSKCFVSPGYALELGGVSAPGIHYNLSGNGRIIIGNAPAIDMMPHTLVVVPENRPFRIEAPDKQGKMAGLSLVNGTSQTANSEGVRRFVAGDGEAEITLICGYFQASYGLSTNLFQALSNPIVEQFAATDRLDHVLKSALFELVAQEIGSGAMSGALLKQVIIMLLRRSLTSMNLWVERFSLLRDPQISKAFSAMVANPGGPHTVVSLAQIAALSRSTFMARFSAIMGQPPMVILRDLRMRQAAHQLKAGDLSIDQVAHNAGYESRSSFIRVFRNAFNCDPSAYKTNFHTA
ncbi:MAG TPA: AraC family transcriptional regulator [Puia sp.]|jgi:AraC family transcriptional activator of mtrCDE